MDKREESEKGFLNENDSKNSTTNLLIMISVISGLLLFTIALYLNRGDAYLPLSNIIAAGLVGVGVKAYRGTS